MNDFAPNLASRTHINPFLFTQDNFRPAPINSSSAFNRLNMHAATNIDPFDDNDVFMPARNPLMMTLEKLKVPKQESFEFDHNQIPSFDAMPFHQAVFAP